MRHALSTLYLTQLVFGLLAFATLGWAWVSALVPLAYLMTLGFIVVALRDEGLTRREGLVLALLWQAPGLLGVLANVLAEAGLIMRIDILDFVLETWHTPLLPWIAALPPLVWRDAVAFYWGLNLLSPLFVLLLPLPLASRARRRSANIEHFRPGGLSY